MTPSQLIADGRMPPADGLSLKGEPCWTWDSICRAFRADPDEMAELLHPKIEQRSHRDNHPS